MPSGEHHLRVPRTARYHLIGEPGRAPEVWFVLHGYRQLAERFIRRFEALPGVEDGRRAVIAPEALSRFYVEERVGQHGPESRVGASWMTRADREHEIRDYVEYLDRLARHALGPPAASGDDSAAPIRGDGRRLVVLGFSQGAETASRWTTYGRIRPAELVLWGGGLAEDLDLPAAADSLREARVTFVAGAGDGWARDRSARGIDRLRAHGLEPRLLTYDGGHRVEAPVLVEHWPASARGSGA